MKNIVAIWDADFIPYYVCHNKKDAPIKTLQDCIDLADTMIMNINNALKVDYYVGYLTTGKCFRYGINAFYKSNRKYDKAPDFMKEVKEHLKTVHNFIGDDYYEADDLVWSFKSQYKQYQGILISPDKDILNLPEGGYNPRLNKFKYTTVEEAVKFFWTSMITGDPVDGITGIKGLGPTAAAKMFNTSNICYRTTVFNKYCDLLGEYEGIKEFTKNYLSLKLVDDVKLKEIKLNINDKQLCE